VLRKPDDEERLTAAIIDLATMYGRYGTRRITALLRASGWLVNRKRVERDPGDAKGSKCHDDSPRRPASG
jgi:hypothetical protein